MKHFIRFVMAKVLNCEFEVNEFKLQSLYVLFLTNTLKNVLNPAFPPSVG